MTYIDDSALEILSTNLDDTNLGYLLDGYFSTIAQREGDITFTVTNRGYKDFVFMNVFCERIDFVFRAEDKEEKISDYNFENGIEGWVVGGNGTPAIEWANNKLHYTANANNQYIQKDVTLEVGKTYVVKISVSSPNSMKRPRIYTTEGVLQDTESNNFDLNNPKTFLYKFVANSADNFIKLENNGYGDSVEWFFDFISIKEEGDTLLTYSHPMYINAAKNCRELLGGIHSVLTDMADVHFDTSYAGTVEITLKAVQEPSPLCKIGKFSYGVPKQIGDLKWGFTFEDIETEKMGLAEDDPDKIVERYELYSAEAVIETNKIANVRQVSRQVKGIKMIWIEPTSGVVLWGKLIFSRISGDNPTSSTIKITIKGIG